MLNVNILSPDAVFHMRVCDGKWEKWEVGEVGEVEKWQMGEVGSQRWRVMWKQIFDNRTTQQYIFEARSLISVRISEKW